MNNQLLIFKIICFLPIINWISLRYFRDYKTFYNFSYNLFPILYFINLYNLNRLHENNYIYFSFFDSIRGISISFGVGKNDIFFLYLIAFIWLCLTFYFNKNFILKRDKNDFYFKEFFILGIGLLNMLVLSKNLFTILFFYSILSIIVYAKLIIMNHNNNNKFLKIYISIIYLQNFLMLIFVAIFFKYNMQMEFFEKIIILNDVVDIKYFILLLLLILSLFLIFLLPHYFFLGKIEIDSLILLSIFVLFSIFSSFFIYFKIINQIIGIEIVKILFNKYGIKWLEIVVFINCFISLFLLIKSDNFKSKVFMLMINQSAILVLSFIVFSSINLNNLQNLLLGFILNFLTIFMCLSNYELLWIKSQKSDIRGIFALMPLTSFLLIFSLFSIVGLAPSISFTNYYSLFKNLYNNNLFFSLFIIILNNLIVAFVIFKIYKIITFVPKKSINEQINANIKNHDKTEELVENIESKSQKSHQVDLIDSQNYKDDDFKILLKIAQKIDYDSRLIISTLIVAILNCASLLLSNNLIF